MRDTQETARRATTLTNAQPDCISAIPMPFAKTIIRTTPVSAPLVTAATAGSAGTLMNAIQTFLCAVAIRRAGTPTGRFNVRVTPALSAMGVHAAITWTSAQTATTPATQRASALTWWVRIVVNAAQGIAEMASNAVTTSTNAHWALTTVIPRQGVSISSDRTIVPVWADTPETVLTVTMSTSVQKKRTTALRTQIAWTLKGRSGVNVAPAFKAVESRATTSTNASSITTTAMTKPIAPIQLDRLNVAARLGFRAMALTARTPMSATFWTHSTATSCSPNAKTPRAHISVHVKTALPAMVRCAPTLTSAPETHTLVRPVEIVLTLRVRTVVSVSMATLTCRILTPPTYRAALILTNAKTLTVVKLPIVWTRLGLLLVSVLKVTVAMRPTVRISMSVRRGYMTARPTHTAMTARGPSNAGACAVPLEMGERARKYQVGLLADGDESQRELYWSAVLTISKNLYLLGKLEIKMEKKTI